MKFKELASYLEKLEKTTSRLEITKILTDLFKITDSNEIDKIVYLSLGILAPNYEGILLNLAEKMMLRVLSKAYDISEEKVKLEYKKVGDVGSVAQLFARGNGNNISVAEVYESLLEITRDSGKGSQDRKVEKMSNLLKSLDSLSAKFVARVPVGKLRLGFSEKTIITALSVGDKMRESEIENAYNIRPDIGFVAKSVKEDKLEKVIPKVGVPVVPMLAQRLNSTSEMIKKMGEVSVEPKFDGLRIFIHYRKKDNFVRIFTRNMNAIDKSIFPELKSLSKFIKAGEIILDTEAVGIDSKREMFLDFQKTISRRRKHNVEKSSDEIPLQFQVFDILLCDGKSFMNTPYKQRREEIEKVVVNGSLLRVDENTITTNPNVIKKFHEKYLNQGLEGVVVKRANGKYVSGRTGWNWVKMKEEEGRSGRLTDTIDCIVMGYFTGKGKRARFGLGMILVGIKDGENIRTLTKIGTGLTESMLTEMKKRIDSLKSKDKPKEYEAQKDLIPDVWANPKLVIEVTADSISKSTKHSLGLSLRFPRFLKVREDKGPNEATTLKELQDLYKMQNA